MVGFTVSLFLVLLIGYVVVNFLRYIWRVNCKRKLPFAEYPKQKTRGYDGPTVAENRMNRSPPTLNHTEPSEKNLIKYGGNWGYVREASKWRDYYRCANCGQPKDGKYRLHTHHIVPKSKGGSEESTNLITLCEACHAALHPTNTNFGVKPKKLTRYYYRSLYRKKGKM